MRPAAGIIAEYNPFHLGHVRQIAAIREASSTSSAPSLREISLPDPCPKKNPHACKTAINENTTPTAAVACVLMRPTKKVSAIL